MLAGDKTLQLAAWLENGEVSADKGVIWLAGDKILELVAWLEKGEISAEEDLLQALAAAPLPRKGTGATAKSAPCAGKPYSCHGKILHRYLLLYKHARTFTSTY